MYKSEEINHVWCGVEDFSYAFNAKKYVEKQGLENIVFLYNVFGLNVDISI